MPENRELQNQESMTATITVVLTSCRRADLLKATLDSFFAHNDYPITRFIVVEDSDDAGVPALIRSEFAGRVELMVNTPRLGQIRSIDRAYATVDTEFIFHCEDDWHFFRPGFIQDSLEVLNEKQDVAIVQLRDLWNNNNHPPERMRYHTASGVWYRLMSSNFRAYNGSVWHGFSLNPGLRRTSDCRAIGPYAALGHEEQIGAAYYARAFRMAILEESAVEHTGNERHVVDINERPANGATTVREVVKLFVPPVFPKLYRLLTRSS